MPEYTKGGNLGITKVNIPDNPRPGKGYDVVVEIENTAAFIDWFDQDKCIENTMSGYNVDIIIEMPNGEKRTRNSCIKKGGALTNTIELTEGFITPETEGDISARAKLELEGSGKGTDWVEDQGVVTREPTERPETPDDQKEGPSYPWEDPGGDDNKDGNNPLSFLDFGDQLEGVGLLVVLLIVVYLVVELSQSGAEAASPIWAARSG